MDKLTNISIPNVDQFDMVVETASHDIRTVVKARLEGNKTFAVGTVQHPGHRLTTRLTCLHLNHKCKVMQFIKQIIFNTITSHALTLYVSKVTYLVWIESTLVQLMEASNEFCLVAYEGTLPYIKITK